MKNKYKLLGLYLPLFIISVISAVAIRTIALFNDFDLITGYFTDKSLISVGDYIVIGTSLLFLTYILMARREFKMMPDFTSPMTYAPTGIIAAALIFVGLNFFSVASETAKNISAKGGNERLIMILSVLVGISALASVAHFALCALIENGTSFKRGDFGLVTVAFLALYSIYLYFDESQALNSPAKNLDQMVFLFAAVFFLYETRLSIGRVKWRSYIAFGFIAALLSAYSSIPALIYYFAESVEISVSIYEMMLSLALFIFITSRIILTCELIEDVESPFARIFAEASDSRTASIKPLVTEDLREEPDTEAIDENQITIDDVCATEEEKASDIKADALKEDTKVEETLTTEAPKVEIAEKAIEDEETKEPQDEASDEGKKTEEQDSSAESIKNDAEAYSAEDVANESATVVETEDAIAADNSTTENKFTEEMSSEKIDGSDK